MLSYGKFRPTNDGARSIFFYKRARWVPPATQYKCSSRNSSCQYLLTAHHRVAYKFQIRYKHGKELVKGGGVLALRCI
jgi:hypothetical protein